MNDAHIYVDQTKYNQRIMALGLPMPDRVGRLKISPEGYPVPWFVAWIDGVPDFRVIAPNKVAQAHNRQLCWICGEQLGRFMAFTIGPMCAVNRISAEPPSHRECAEFAVRACPFLTQPKMRRNEKGLPSEAEEPAGLMIARNPGVSLIWITRTYRVIRDGGRGILFKVGDPEILQWFAEGRPATRAEVEASVKSGLPLLEKQARDDGHGALEELGKMVKKAQPLFDAIAA